MYLTFVTYSSVDGHLGCFHVLTTVNRAAMNIGVHVSIWIMVFSGHIPRENHNLKNTCTSMFTAALFTIAKTWKQPKCPSTEEWIKKVRYIYTREYYSAIKRNKITPLVATWMNLEILILSEICQRQISYDITHTWN